MADDHRAAELLTHFPLLDALPFAMIGTDASGSILTWNRGAENLYGYARDEVLGLDIKGVTHSEEAGDQAQTIRAAVVSGDSWSGEFPVRRKDGAPFLARVTLIPVLEAGTVIGIFGVSEDVSDLRFHQTQASDSRDRLRLALDASGLGAWEWDVSTGRVHWDERMEEIFGFAPGTFPGTYDAWHATLHPDDRTHVLGSVQQAVALKSRNNLEHRIIRTDGSVRWIESHSQPVTDADGTVRGTIGCVRDITAWKHAELERQRLRQQELFLAEAGDRLSASLEVDHTLTIVADLAVPTVADWCLIHLVEDRRLRPALLRHRHAAGQLLLARIVERWPAHLDDPGGVADTIRTGQPRLSALTADLLDAATAAGDERAAAFRELDMRSVIVVPLQARGRVVGAVTFGRDREEAFDVEEQAMLAQLASRAALAIDNAVTYERERRAALTLQHSLLPQIAVTVPGLTIAARYIAGAAGAQVGGDWYDAIPLADGRVAITVGDVMGHGLAAAALMGQVRAALRGIAATGSGPAEALRILDGVVGTLSETQLVTCAYGIFDPATSLFTFSSAGHPPPLLVRPREAPVYLDVDPGAPLGVGVAGGQFAEATAELTAGATLLLFTDGLIESRERSLDDGLDALRELAASGDNDLERLSDRLIAGMHAGVTADDDTALLVLRVN
ncbi:MAG: rsbP 5 [Frankiales bacterium]|nr:rsbP 5 [Frankiales bacterium]